MPPVSRRAKKRSMPESNITPTTSTEVTNELSNVTANTTLLIPLISVQATEIVTNNEMNFIFQQL